MSKYHAVRTVVNGIAFASRAEATAYQNRLLLLQAGDISDLELQPKFPIVIDGQYVCTYVADFRYRLTATGAIIVEDVKGVRTAVYKLKKKLVKALYGIDILESNGDDLPFGEM